MSEITKLMGDSAYSVIHFNEQQIVDVVGESTLTEKDVESRLKFYKVKEGNSLVFLDKAIRNQEKEGITLVKVRKMVGFGL